MFGVRPGLVKTRGFVGDESGLSHGWVSAMTEPPLDGEVRVGKA